MKPLSPLGYGVALAITVGILYLSCAVVSMIAPAALADAIDVVAHGVNISPLTDNVAPVKLGDVIIGLLYIGCYSFVAGVLFGAIRNRMAGTSRETKNAFQQAR